MLLPPLAGELLARCTFPERGAPIDVAVSGGSDSLALLLLAVAAGCEVRALHVDHALREGSAAEADVVAANVSRLGATFVALSAPVEPGPNLEARARAVRLGVLPPGVATGHTADDQAETVLLNLLRGSGLDGLSAMRPGPRHPILAIRRAEAARLVERAALAVVHDPSNDDPAFSRNRVRHELLPLMASISGRDPVPVLCRQADLVSEERDLLESLAGAIDPTEVASLRAAPLALRRRALRRWLRDGQYPPDAAALERVIAVVSGDALACELAGGRRVRRRRGRLELSAAGPLRAVLERLEAP